MLRDNEPLEIQDSDDSDTVPRAGESSRSRALVVDSPSPKKKQRAPRKQTSISAKAAARLARIKSNPYVLDDVDEDDAQPSPPRRRDEEEDEVMVDEPYDNSFINDDEDDKSSDTLPSTSPKRRKRTTTTTNGNASEKGKAKPKSKTPVRRKKQLLAEESAPGVLLPIFDDDEEDQDFVPDSADEGIAPPAHPPTRSSRKGKQKQVDVDVDVDAEDGTVIPIGAAYSDGPNDSGEQTETDTPGRRASTSKSRPPRNRRLAVLADEHQATTTSSTTTGNREPDEYGYTDDEPVDLTEEDPIDGGIIDVDYYDDAPSQRFRDLEAELGPVKREPGAGNGAPSAAGGDVAGNGNVDGVNAVDEFDDDDMFDQGFMDNLQDLDYMDLGAPDDTMNGDFGNSGPGTTHGGHHVQPYTRTAGGMAGENSSNAQYSSEEEDDPADRFIPISALPEADRDFFLNHWRRSATEAQGLTGSEKQLAESRQQQAQAAANPRGRGRGGRSGGGGWRGRGRGGWRGKR